MDARPEQVVVAYDSGSATLAAPPSAPTAPPPTAEAVRWWPTRSRLWGIVVLALVYYGAARFGFAFGFSGSIAAIVWLPVGVAAAFLTIGGLSFWPGALIGDLLANDYHTIPLSGAVGQTVGNLLEVLVIAAITRRLMKRGLPLESLGGVVGLLGAIAAGVAVSAIVGPLSLLASGGLHHPFVHVSWTWWLGDSCGALLVLPLALAWTRRRHLRLTLPRTLEAAAVLAAIAALSWIAATGVGPAYAIVPVLALAAIRFGPRAATSTVFVSVAIVVWGETDRHRGFEVGAFANSVLKTQTFIIVAAASSLFWTALVAEREHAVQELEASQIRAFTAAEAERRRMERNLHDGAQQSLLALAVKLGLRARAETPTERWFLADVESELRTAIDEESRDLSHGIHPSVLSGLGLAGAIRTLAGRSAIPVTLLELPTHRAAAESQAAVYYAVTEAIANAQKHSGASSIRVRVSSDRRWVRVVVTDDGVGGASESAGTGISGIRHRMEALGGTFALESPRAIGTQITAAVPISETP